MRIFVEITGTCLDQAFLSIQAQDFIEERGRMRNSRPIGFLSIQAQDFIEDEIGYTSSYDGASFLSIQAQDFIEELVKEGAYGKTIDS